MSIFFNRVVPAAAAAFLTLSFSLAPAVVQAKSMTLRLGHVMSADSPWGRAADSFAKMIKERTDGEITINVYPDGQLGGDEAMGRDQTRGALDLSFLSPSSMSGTDPLLDINYLPYIVDNYAEADKVLYNPDGVLIKTLEDSLSKLNIVWLAPLENDFRSVTNSKHAVKDIGDMKGLKLRVPPADVLVKFFRLTGAQPVSMPFPELFSALQQGTVDGQDNGPILTYTSRLYEAQKYMTLTNHVLAYGGITVSKSLWNKLDDKQKQIFKEVSDQVSADEIKDSREVNAEDTKKMEAAGIKVQKVSPELLASMHKISRQVWKEMEPVYGSDRIQALEKEVDAVRGK